MFELARGKREMKIKVIAIFFFCAAVLSAIGGAQSTTGALDLDMYSRIRAEGFSHSRVMAYASALLDGIGPRLTGSSNMTKASSWTKDTLVSMGSSNVHLESWGDFGMGWRQISTSVCMSAPDKAVFIAQATPWSPATKGNIHAEVVSVPKLTQERDFENWVGDLKNKIVLYGEPPAIVPDLAPLSQSFDAKKLARLSEYPLDRDFSEQGVVNVSPEEWATNFQRAKFQEQVAKFFADQGVLAVLVPSYAGDGGIMRDDNNVTFGQFVYRRDRRQPIPSAVIANEAFGRVSRLIAHHVYVQLDVNIQTQFTGDHEQGYNTIAEIKGVDPKLGAQVVLFGAHLDSWIAGTGATDNGAGVVIGMEAMRILTALHARPRRTIRIALWSGEEQGELGSLEYVHQHLAIAGYTSDSDQVAVPTFLREKTGQIARKPEYQKFSAYFNIDNGGGKLQGIYVGGNVAAAAVFKQWIEPLRDLGVTTISLRPSGSSDQDSFNDVGLPGFQFLQSPRDCRTRSVHSNQDTYERLSSAELEQAAIIEAIFVYNAAVREQLLPRMPAPVSVTSESGQESPATPDTN